ncbi:MAG: sensor domain-containing diguanylate cyclase [Candidatus Omnitrophota bacterium]
MPLRQECLRGNFLFEGTGFMLLIPILALGIIAMVILAAVLLRKNINLNKKSQVLEKEIAIQSDKLSYQKKTYSEAANYFYSTMVIIIEIIREIESVLRSEEGDLSEKVLQIIFEKVKTILDPQKCVLFTINNANHTSACLYAFGYDQEKLDSLNPSIDADNSFLGWTAVTGRFLSISDAKHDSVLRHLIDTDPIGCHYAQPFKVQNKVRAVLCVGEIKQNMQDDFILRLFSILSNITAISLNNASLTQQLRELSVKDGLTGVYNHSYFQKWLKNALAELNGKNTTLSLAMVDLDNFKTINDTYGHQTGDLMLQAVTSALNSIKTPDYICARYGGDEFVLGFKNKDINQTQAIMTRVREKIAQELFSLQNNGISVTISIGVAEARFSENKKINKTDLIKSVDQALYQAKAAGRNTVVIADISSYCV